MSKEMINVDGYSDIFVYINNISIIDKKISPKINFFQH